MITKLHFSQKRRQRSHVDFSLKQTHFWKQLKIWSPLKVLFFFSSYRPLSTIKTFLYLLFFQRTRPSLQIVNSGKKVDISKQGLNSVDDDVVRNNLQGTSRYMKNKEWVDAQGRKGKVYINLKLH